MLPTDAAPDAELARLLDALTDAAAHPTLDSFKGPIRDREHAARAALLDYLARAYLRLPPPLDGEPVAMEEAAGDEYRRRSAT
jgi:hypothetical protein